MKQTKMTWGQLIRYKINGSTKICLHQFIKALQLKYKSSVLSQKPQHGAAITYALSTILFMLFIYIQRKLKHKDIMLYFHKSICFAYYWCTFLH